MKEDIIVITGGASGIGRALSELYLKSSEHVIAIDIDQKNLDELTNWAKSFDYHFYPKNINITKTDEIEKLITEMENMERRIKIWIHCAGMSGVGAFEELKKEEYDRVLDLNLISIVNSTRFILKHMQGHGVGKIVNISSVAGFVPAPLMSAYNLTKHALVGFTRSMQLEMRYTGSPIDFVLVCPGFVETKMIKKGQDLGFPDWLSPILSTPEKVASEIFLGLKKNKLEIYPTMNGKTLISLHKHFPHFVRSQARLLTVKSLKDFILNKH